MMKDNDPLCTILFNLLHIKMISSKGKDLVYNNIY